MNKNELKILKVIIFRGFLCLKTKQNNEMSDGEHPDSIFYYPEQQETAERKGSHHDRHFDKVEASRDTGMKSPQFDIYRKDLTLG